MAEALVQEEKFHVVQNQGISLLGWDALGPTLDHSMFRTTHSSQSTVRSSSFYRRSCLKKHWPAFFLCPIGELIGLIVQAVRFAVFVGILIHDRSKGRSCGANDRNDRYSSLKD